MDGVSNEGSASPVPVQTSTEPDESLSSLISNINRWVHEGQPILNDLLQDLHESKIRLDPIVETFVFSVVGGYTWNFSAAMQNGDSITDANSHAITALMHNPKITSMMEQFMQQKVSEHIESAVE